MAKHKHKKKSTRKKIKEAIEKKIGAKKKHNLTHELMEGLGAASVGLPVEKKDSPLIQARMGRSAKLAEKVAKTGELTEKDLKRPKRKGILETLKGLREKARGKKKKKKEEEKE